MKAPEAMSPTKQPPKNMLGRLNQQAAMICFKAICFQHQHAAAQECQLKNTIQGRALHKMQISFCII
jgi:hypothetical protein